MPPTKPNRRTLIVNTALEMFTTRGYTATTYGDIAEALDTSKAAIAYHFPTKERFLDEFIAPIITALDNVTPSIAHPTYPDVALDQLGAYLDVLIDNHAVAIWIDTDPVIVNAPEYGQRLRTINDRLIRTITNNSRRKADRARALAVLGGIWRPTRDLSTEQLREHRDELIRAALVSYAPID